MMKSKLCGCTLPKGHLSWNKPSANIRDNRLHYAATLSFRQDRSLGTDVANIRLWEPDYGGRHDQNLGCKR